MLLIMEIGLLCLIDSWVTHNTFWEQNNQKTQLHIIVMLIVKRPSFVSTMSALVFLPIPSDF